MSGQRVSEHQFSVVLNEFCCTLVQGWICKVCTVKPTCKSAPYSHDRFSVFCHTLTTGEIFNKVSLLVSLCHVVSREWSVSGQ